MAANKEAIAIVLDVGPSMNQAPAGETTALQTAIDAITMILQRKMFSESKDEVSLILLGTPATDNPLAVDGGYDNISIARPLGLADFDLLQMVKNDITPSDTYGDFLDAIVVAMDHLVSATQGKKGFASKRVILLSDLAGPFGDDQLDTIVGALHNSGTELNVIGPHIDDDDDENGGRTHGKEKTPQQQAGETLIKHILDQVNGECYSFSEALPALSYFQTRQVRPTAWKCQLQIGPDLKIPINGYAKIKDFKLKQSWKRVYAKDPDMEIGNVRTFHMNDEEETEVEREDIVEGFRYGNTLVPMSEDDKENMKYVSEKCFSVLGFTKSENVKQHQLLGDGILTVLAEKGDEAAGVALSALINAMYETNMVAIVRRVYAARSAPRIGVLFPHIKAEYECLYYAELPFSEDIRQFTFGTLPISEESTANKKYAPTAEQLSAVDNLITSMDLSKACVDEDGEETEALKPKLTFNPFFQRLYQKAVLHSGSVKPDPALSLQIRINKFDQALTRYKCLQHRATNPDEGLPELSPIIAQYLKPPQEILTKCEEKLQKIKNKFKLEVIAKKKDTKTGENMFKENDAEVEHAGKRQKLDDDLEGGMEDIAKAKVTQVGSVTPIEDFLALVGRKHEDLFEEACKQMQKRIWQLVKDSFGLQFYSKAVDCLKALREQCVKKSEALLYNKFIREHKDLLISKGRRDFWKEIIREKQGLVSKSECRESNISKNEADKFLADDVVTEEKSADDDDDDDDDLFDQLE